MRNEKKSRMLNNRKQKEKKRKNLLFRQALTMIAVTVVVGSGGWFHSEVTDAHTNYLLNGLLQCMGEMDLQQKIDKGVNSLFQNESMRKIISTTCEDGEFYFTSAVNFLDLSQYDEDYNEQNLSSSVERLLESSDFKSKELKVDFGKYFYSTYDEWMANEEEEWETLTRKTGKNPSRYCPLIFRTRIDENNNRVYEVWNAFFCIPDFLDVMEPIYWQWTFSPDYKSYTCYRSRYGYDVTGEHGIYSYAASKQLCGFCEFQIYNFDAKSNEESTYYISGNLNSEATFEEGISLSSEELPLWKNDDENNIMPTYVDAIIGENGVLNPIGTESIPEGFKTEYLVRNEWITYYNLLGLTFPSEKSDYNFWDEYFIEDDMIIRYDGEYTLNPHKEYFPGDTELEGDGSESTEPEDNPEEDEVVKEEDSNLEYLIDLMDIDIDSLEPGTYYTRGFPVFYEWCEDGVLVLNLRDFEETGSLNWKEMEISKFVSDYFFTDDGKHDLNCTMASVGYVIVNPVYLTTEKVEPYVKYKALKTTWSWLGSLNDDYISINDDTVIYFDPNLTKGKLVEADLSMWDLEKIRVHEVCKYKGVKYATLNKNGIRYITKYN